MRSRVSRLGSHKNRARSSQNARGPFGESSYFLQVEWFEFFTVYHGKSLSDKNDRNILPDIMYIYICIYVDASSEKTANYSNVSRPKLIIIEQNGLYVSYKKEKNNDVLEKRQTA